MKIIALLGALSILATACGGGATPASSAPASVAASGAASASPAPPPISLKFNWTAVSGASSGLWTAAEAGYFKDEGITAEIVNIASSSRAVAALLAKEVQFTHLDGQVAVDANAGGATNIKLIQAVNNKLVFSVMTKKEITKPADLKGKKLGITTPGSSTHTAALLALRQWGMTDKDVTFISLSEVPNILTGLISGQIDAGVVSPPTNTRAKAAGFSELINLAKEGPDWPSVGVGTTTDYLTANPTVGVRVVRAYSRGIQRFKADKAFGIATLKKYLQLDDQAVLEDTWTQYSGYLPEIPYVLGVQATIDVVAAANPKAVGLKVENIFDPKYVKQLEDEGFYKKLYGK